MKNRAMPRDAVNCKAAVEISRIISKQQHEFAAEVHRKCGKFSLNNAAKDALRASQR